jgi:DNA-binding response OmpR family regulator
MSNGKKEVLVIEADEVERELAGKFLSYYEYNPIIVQTGAAGVEYCQKSRPDLVLIDVEDPADLEVIKQIREIAGFDKIPMIVISPRDIRDEALKAGCNSFFPKNFDPDELLAELQKY